MKKELSEFPEIVGLKRNEKLHADCLYILNSESVASNTYFETKRDIIRAHKMMKRHLNPIMNIVDYLFTPNGWVLVVAVKSEQEILDSINMSRYTSKKMRKAIRKKKISVIISECLRYTISGIARITNQYNRRFGTLVRRNFSRFIFENLEIAETVMKKMKRMELKLCCQRKRYRPSLRWFDKEGKLRGDGDVFLNSKNYGKDFISGVTGIELIVTCILNKHVLRNLIESTFNLHFNPHITHSPTKSPQDSLIN